MFHSLSEAWLNSHHADGQLHLASYSYCCGGVSSAEHVVASLPIHRIVVSSVSPYFSALLGPTWASLGPQQQTIKLVLSEAADVAAMVALVKCIYTGALDVTEADLSAILAPCSCASAVREHLATSSTQQQWLRVIRQADQYAVHGVMDVAVSKLTSLFSHQVRLLSEFCAQQCCSRWYCSLLPISTRFLQVAPYVGLEQCSCWWLLPCTLVVRWS